MPRMDGKSKSLKNTVFKTVLLLQLKKIIEIGCRNMRFKVAEEKIIFSVFFFKI
jgi:hypothetical protein